MGAYAERLSEALAIAADGIHSAVLTASEKLTGAIDLSKFRRILFLIDTGTLGASGTLDFQVKGSATSGGTYTAIAGTAITQLVVASNNNQYVFVEVSTEAIQALGLGYAFIKGSLVPGTASANSSVIALGSAAPYKPDQLQGSTTTIAQKLAI